MTSQIKNFTLYSLCSCIDHEREKRKTFSYKSVVKDLSVGLNVPHDVMLDFFNSYIQGNQPNNDEFIKNFKIPVDGEFVKIFSNLSFFARIFLINGLDESFLFGLKKNGLEGIYSDLDNRILKTAKNCKFEMSNEDEKIWKSVLSERMLKNQGVRESVDDVDTIIELVKFEKHRDWLINSENFISGIYQKYQYYQYATPEEEESFFNSVRQLDLSKKIAENVLPLLMREENITIRFKEKEYEEKTILEVKAFSRVSFDLFKQENIKSHFKELFPEMMYVDYTMHRTIYTLDIQFKGKLEKSRREEIVTALSSTVFNFLVDENEAVEILQSLLLKKKIGEALDYKYLHQEEDFSKSSFKM